MAHFNNTNSTGLYPVSDVPGEDDFYPFLAQTSATEGIDNYTNTTFPDCRSTVEQQEPVVYSATSFWATASNCGECYFNLVGCQRLTREPQSQWLRPPRMQPRTMATVSRRIPDTIGQRLVNGPNVTTPASRIGMAPLPDQTFTNQE